MKIPEFSRNDRIFRVEKVGLIWFQIQVFKSVRKYSKLLQKHIDKACKIMQETSANDTRTTSTGSIAHRHQQFTTQSDSPTVLRIAALRLATNVDISYFSKARTLSGSISDDIGIRSA